MKILVVLSRIPYPLEKGDKLRAYYQLKHLAQKHQLILVALNDKKNDAKAIEHLQSFCEQVHVFQLKKWSIFLNLVKAFFSGIPFQVAYFYNASIRKKVEIIIEQEQPDRIFAQLIRTSEYVKEQYHIVKTIDFMDTFSKGIERRIEKEKIILKPFLRWEHLRLLKYENKIFDFFEHHCIISEQDRDYIPHQKNKSILVIKNGVDLDFYTPKHTEKIYDILFSGHLNYPPNVVSVKFLINNIFPLLKIKIPNIKILIAGAEPSHEIKKLEQDGITIMGWVDDIRECYYQSKLFVAPMKISIGLQNKLLQAQSMKIPCITTSLANNALGAKNNEEIILAETAEEFCDKIIHLLNDKQLYEQIAQNAQQFVQQNYSWNAENTKLEELITQ